MLSIFIIISLSFKKGNFVSENLNICPTEQNHYYIIKLHTFLILKEENDLDQERVK